MCIIYIYVIVFLKNVKGSEIKKSIKFFKMHLAALHLPDPKFRNFKDKTPTLKVTAICCFINQRIYVFMFIFQIDVCSNDILLHTSMHE